MFSQKLPLQAEKILTFWFEGLTNEHTFNNSLYSKWFGSTNEINSYIIKEFSQDLTTAELGIYDTWKDSPFSALALIILLDQFSRNIFKGTALAFENDSKALKIALESIDKKYDLQVWPVQRLFFYLPLEHSEDIKIQDKSVEMFEILQSTVGENLKEFAQGNLNFAYSHRNAISQFGRFPGRNSALGRQSTEAETRFLIDHPQGF